MRLASRRFSGVEHRPAAPPDPRVRIAYTPRVARALVVGLDGLDLDVVRGFGPAALPRLHRLMGEGAYGALESVQPPATLPNWTTFLTGLDPARHGVFDFTTRRGYRVRFTGGTARSAPTLFQRLDEAGLRCACLSFPGTWPPERLEHGVFVSGWDAPVAFSADRSFMWPEALYDETVREFGAPTFDDVDEFRADAPGWTDRLPAALERRIERKTAWARWLLQRRDWDVFAIYFGESDTASHYLWALHDPSSPRRPDRVSATQRDGLRRVYQALDAAVGELIDQSGQDTEVTLLSDHGSGGSSDKVVYLNRLLAREGLLRFKRGGRLRAGALKEIALRNLTPRLRERLFRVAGTWLPSRLESNVRFGAIDMDHTVAFSDELNYFPGVFLNVAGREPRGTVPASDTHQAALRVRAALLRTRDPWTGRPVFADVIPRQDLYEGPHLERAPDLLLHMHLDDGYSYNVMPSGAPARAEPRPSPFRKLQRSEHAGKKGRSLPGSHRPFGFMALAGPRTRAVGQVQAHIADLSATLLHRLDLSVPTDFMGRPLWEALLGTGSGPTLALPDVDAVALRRPDDESVIEARLRALGYIE